MMKVNEKYLSFYKKRPFPMKLPYKLTNEKNIDIAFSKTSESKLQQDNINPAHSFCVYNPFSVVNIIRENEHDTAYVDESEKETASTDKLKNELMELHKKLSKDCKFILDNYSKSFELYGKFPVDNDIKFGVVYVDVVCDVEARSIKDYIKLFSNEADHLGYNFVDYEFGRACNVQYDGETYKCQKIIVQLEASYVDPLISKGDILYHMMPKSYLTRVIDKKQGLVASNKNSMGLSYPSRVYCFIDRNDELKKEFARATKKRSLKFIKSDSIKTELKDYYMKLQDKQDGQLFDSKEFVILSIDTAKLGNVRFYLDCMFNINDKFVAVYTTSNIPYNALTTVGEFHI